MADLRALSSASNLIRFKLTNSSTGAGVTGLTFSSTGLIISTICDNESSATAYTSAGSTIETISTLGTFAAPTSTKCRFKEVDSINHPGLYEFQFADTRFSVGSSKRMVVSVPSVSGLSLAQADYEIQLTGINVYDAVHGGMSAIPNATAGAANGLQICGSNAATAFATLTVTGALTISDGIAVTCSTAGNTALSLTGNTSGSGLSATGGSSGSGVVIAAGASGTIGMSVTGTAGGAGAKFTGGVTGPGLQVTAGATGAAGMTITGTGSGGNGLTLTGAGTGLGFSANTLTVSGAVSFGSTFGVTGATTFTGNVGMAAGLSITQSSSNASALVVTGNGTGNGATITSGSGTTGVGLSLVANSTNGAALNLAGKGTGAGLLSTGGLTGQGFLIVGGGTSGDGIKITTTSGHGINSAPVGSSVHGFFSTGGNGGTSDGMKLVAGTGGVDLRANQTGDLTGNVSGSVGSVTARVTANTDQLAGQTVTAGAGVTFPASVASPTNITAGTITTTTNLTNAPTAGDFTATMKTSLNAATPAVTVSDKTGFSLSSTQTFNNTGTWTGNISGSVGSIGTGGIVAATFAPDSITAAALKADAATEIATASNVVLSGVHGAGSWEGGGGGGGGGAFAITITVNDGSTALQNVAFGIYDGGGIEVGSGLTDASGNGTLSADAGTYTVALVKGGYTFTPTTRTVTGNQAGTLVNALSMTAAVPISPPADPTLCTVAGYLKDTSGNAIEGEKITFQLIPGDSNLPMVSNGSVIFFDSVTAKTDGAGYVSANVIRTSVISPAGATYTITGKGGEFEKTGVTLTGATQDLAAL